MNPSRAICAGFLPDLVAALREAADREPLADLLPFVDGCGPRFEAHLNGALGAAAARFAVPIPARCFEPAFAVSGTIRARRLDRAAVSLLARYDDLALGALYRETATACGEDAVATELPMLLRALVIQCRAAVANGWVVLLIEAA